jgi:murein tripeptide amidase MpaA
VHPGESNASYMMEGFIRFISHPTNAIARELRSRIIFKIIPFLNPDGVMVGNYRVSMAGSDLNRRYQNPHPKLHPIVCAVKKLIKEEKGDPESKESQILAFVDMHGHSRKKNVFMYGPEFPIHDNRYLQMRVIPKLMSE